MPDLMFRALGAEAATHAVSLAVEITDRVPEEAIQLITLRCQIHIEAARRRYSPEEQARLVDLFGEPERWGQTLRPMLWANVSTEIAAFAGTSSIRIQVPSSSDSREAATKYFQSLDGGTVLLTLLFSGMIFYLPLGGQIQVAPISWDREARLGLPVDVWKQSVASNQNPRSIEASV